MASSRKNGPSDLPGRVRAALAPHVTPGARVVVGLSGGVDSVVLLSIAAALAAGMRFSLRAAHVHHGISANADQWAQFCARLCAGLGVPLQVERVDISPYRAHGVEGAARRARYEALARVDADVLALAHHRDDQVETFLLQLLRGAGVRGLSAMPQSRLAHARTRLLRPLLGAGRGEIESHARERGLPWIEDESNADLAHRRNFVRHELLPLAEREFPGARAAIARASGRLAEAGALLDDLARADLERAGAEEPEVAVLAGLGPARARNVLRYLCHERGISIPSSARLEELLRQLTGARGDGSVAIDLSGWSFRRFRGRLRIDAPGPVPERDFRLAWQGENALALPGLGGVLRFKPEEGRGASVARISAAAVTVRLRRGGERLRPDRSRPTRTLKNLLQERGVPPWRRARLPLVYCGETLVAVPGVGVDCAYQAQGAEAGLIISWETGE